MLLSVPILSISHLAKKSSRERGKNYFNFFRGVTFLNLFTICFCFCFHRYARKKMSLAQRRDSAKQKKDAFRKKLEAEDE